MTTKPRVREGRNAAQERGLRVMRKLHVPTTSANKVAGAFRAPGSTKKAPRVGGSPTSRTRWFGRGSARKVVEEVR